ncbi:hypothetical protein [Alteribacter aurantiacus]|uniref:hypothetical protein n=1 Tax=Alteribacter aurantiacus TaxID=254410 RepID=UPI0003F887EF|nr:hypothetical protein [Alteribacter aurantiacus]
MEHIRTALWLVRFELTVSKKHYLFLFFLAGIYAFFLYISMPGYLEDNFFLVDLFLIIYIVTISFTTKPKGIQYQKINNSLFASPYFAMLSQLPIERSVLIASRFILLFLASVGGTVLVLVMTYLSSPEFQATIVPLQLISLIMIWICITFSLGGMFPASDPGDRIKRFTFFWSYVIIIVFLISLYLIFQVWLGTGIFNWTIYLASEYTIISLIGFLVAACLVTWYWFHLAKRKIQNIDYLH